MTGSTGSHLGRHRLDERPPPSTLRATCLCLESVAQFGLPVAVPIWDGYYRVGTWKLLGTERGKSLAKVDDSTLITPVGAASGRQTVGGVEQNDMSEPVSEPGDPKGKLRWFQFSLRTLLVFVTFVSVLCSIGVCLGWRVALAVVVLAIFYGGGLVDCRRVSTAVVFQPRWLATLLRALILLLSIYGGFAGLLMTGMVLTPTGDPYSILLVTTAVSIPACVCYAFGRRMASVSLTTDTGAFVVRPFQLALVAFACIFSLFSLFLF